MPPHSLKMRGMRRTGLGGGAVLLLVMLGSASCQARSGSLTSEPTASASASPGVAECPDIDLQSPQGTRIDLNGMWTTGSAEAGDRIVYEIRQSGECLWGRAYSAYQGQEPGESFDIVLVGTVRSDSTADVDLLEIRVAGNFQYATFGRASVTFAIRFEGAAGGERVSLEIVTLRARSVGLGDPGGRLFGTGGPIVGAILTRSP